MDKKLIVCAIAAAFAASVSAQSNPPATDVNKEKQQMMKDATAGVAKGSGQSSAEGSANAAKTKGTPRMLSDKASKREAVNAATSSTVGKGSGATSAEGSAKAAADKSARKAKPKPTLDSPEMKAASKP